MDTITRTFTAVLAGRQQITLSQGDSARWFAYDQAGNRLGVLTHLGQEGYMPANPARHSDLVLVSEKLIGRPKVAYAKSVTNVQESTPPCHPDDYRALQTSIEVCLQPLAYYHHGEAWQEVVVMPQRMTWVEVTERDFIEAMVSMGWSLDRNKVWKKTS